MTSRFLLVIEVVIVIIVIICFVLLFGLVFLGFCIIFFLFLRLLYFRKCLPLLGELVGFSAIVSDDDVVEDGSSLHLPEIKTNETKVGILVHTVIIFEFGIVNFFGRPDSLVGRIGDALHEPF